MDPKLVLPLPSALRSLSENSKTPVVYKNLISHWETLSWSLEKWSDKLGSKLMPFRSAEIVPIKEPQWEGMCQTVHLSMQDFVKTAELKSLPAQWLYFDYKHMSLWFEDNPEILETVSWENLGFPERKGAESTLWIGSKGAHTACHIDTYGFNLVAQIYGRKRWILFPPESSGQMLPTRVPYEESSIYSSRNLNYPELNLADELHDVHVVTLNPGEVLLVPHHWWHYVENLETAISINTWVPLPSDDMSRLDESLVRFFVSQICKDVTDPQSLLNPNEVDLVDVSPLSESVNQIQASLQQCTESCNEMSDCEPKKMKLSVEPKLKCNESEAANSCFDVIEEFKTFISVVPKCPRKEFQDLLVEKRNFITKCLGQCKQNLKKDVTGNLRTEEKPQDYFLKKVINGFCHPDVISLIREKIITCVDSK